MNILENLNQRQREAVEYCDGPELVLAGAGSGKTKVLTTKIAYLISEKRVLPWKIVALTFTNKAAKEMRDRVEALIGSGLSGMNVCTFHSYGLRFLRRCGEALQKLGYRNSFVIFDRSDTKSIIKKLLEELNIDQKQLSPAEAIEMISNAKTASNPVTREVRMHSSWQELYDRYQKTLLEQNALDFDDLMVLPLHILATNQEVREIERGRIEWVLVDEYQDVNTPQYLLLRLLVDESRKIMVVGDPDQSIYGWRGADMSVIMNFERHFAGAKVVVLDQNYRSTGQILKAANGVIRNNSDRHPKDLWTAASEGTSIQVYRAKNDLDESQWICKNINRLLDEGYRYGEMAILYRVNALSRGIEQQLLENALPYRVIRGLAFYERAEVKDVLSMMRLAVNPSDSVSLARIANVPVRGLGKKSVENLSAWLWEHRKESPEDIWSLLEKCGAELKGKAKDGAKELARNMLSILASQDNMQAVINDILYTQGYEDYLKENKPDDWAEKEENVLEILSLVPEDGTLDKLLAEISLYTDADTPAEIEDSINLLTLHAAKGLEFPVVFIIGMEEGLFPNSRSVSGESDIAEERRLCYVGMTRAREKLFMSGAASRLLFGGIQSNTTSRFIGEIPPDCKETEDNSIRSWEDAYNRTHRRRWSW
ncbi:MAG: UvrD-helicase domain-containing protein [Synergistaceae bacterium]|nr:UvrD-helicase domain-containing protein [Synergistaceae bacterium]